MTQENGFHSRLRIELDLRDDMIGGDNRGGEVDRGRGQECISGHRGGERHNRRRRNEQVLGGVGDL